MGFVNWSMACATIILLAQTAFAVIQFELQETNQKHSPFHRANYSQDIRLVRSLERITCMPLEIRNRRLQMKQPALILFASFGVSRHPIRTIFADGRCSATARALLSAAIKSANVYKVRENRTSRLARTSPSKFIELNLEQIQRIVYRGVPPEVFDIGMIFLHELTHRQLNLSDPKKDEIRKDRLIKGEAVTFINRIEKELGLPERQHYAMVKIRCINGRPRWGIYFGEKPAHVELDPQFGGY